MRNVRTYIHIWLQWLLHTHNDSWYGCGLEVVESSLNSHSCISVQGFLQMCTIADGMFNMYVHTYMRTYVHAYVCNYVLYLLYHCVVLTYATNVIVIQAYTACK